MKDRINRPRTPQGVSDTDLEPIGPILDRVMTRLARTPGEARRYRSRLRFQRLLNRLRTEPRVGAA